MIAPRISLKSLSLICRSLSTMLQSGVSINRAFETTSRKLGDARCRRTLADVADCLKKGDDITEALRQQGGYFPALFVDMINVAENTGTLPEVLHSLAGHYENIIELRRNFLSAITMPVIQLLAAIFIIAGMIMVLGMIAESRGGESMDVLGWGLTGTSGAVSFLCMAFGTIAGIIGGYFFISHTLGQQRALHTMLLHVPVLGHCMRSFAIARFSWAYYLTQQAGMGLVPSLDASLRATGNGAFAGASGMVCAMVREGEDLTTALTDTRLFPQDYLEMVYVGETSGTVPEMLQRLSPNFEEDARRSLSLLANAMGVMVWMIVAGFIIFVIFSIVSWYLGLLNGALNDAMGV